MNDSFEDRGERPSQTSEYEYRTLCVSNWNEDMPDHECRDALYDKFTKYGDFNVKVVHTGDDIRDRIAYLNFRYPEDAREAKLGLSGNIIVFDRPLRIDAVYNKRQRSPSPFRGDRYPVSDGPRGRGRSLSPTGSRRSGRPGSMERGMAPRGRDFQDNFDRRREAPFDDNGQPKERFPHHLQHIRPEEDLKATRTLFAGNLDYNIADEEVQKLFEPYGYVEDVDIKRPMKGAGNAYAFVRFLNLDMAHRAKVDLSGQYIGKYQIKIGYGKATPTNCLWIGGLGPWVRPEKLEMEFDRFGVIHKIEWPQDKNYAYILYDNVDAASAACTAMRGYPLGGPDRKLRVDFADVNHIETAHMSPPRPSKREDKEFIRKDTRYEERDSRGEGGDWRGGRGGYSNGKSRGREDYGPGRDDFNRGGYDRKPAYDDNRRGSNMPPDRRGGGRGGYRGGFNERRTFSPDGYGGPDRYDGPSRGRDMDMRGRGGHSPPYAKRARHGSPPFNDRDGFGARDRGEFRGENGRTRGPDNWIDRGVESSNVGHVDNLDELGKSLPVVWSGALVLKNSAFSARMHLVSGDVRIVDTLMRDLTSTEIQVLRITQRLRLDPTKLEEVGRRVSGSGGMGHAILLAMPGSTNPNDDPSATTQQRPLRNLVSYLKQKEAAGVIALPPNPSKNKDNIGVLHAFPPCSFGHEYLRDRAPKLVLDTQKDDHLVIIVVRGPA